jgi:hypothetical protein
MQYLSEHPSLPPMQERAASSLRTLLRSLREIRSVADDAHDDLAELPQSLDLRGCIPDALAELIGQVEAAMEAIGASVPVDRRALHARPRWPRFACICRSARHERDPYPLRTVLGTNHPCPGPPRRQGSWAWELKLGSPFRSATSASRAPSGGIADAVARACGARASCLRRAAGWQRCAPPASATPRATSPVRSCA